MKNLTIDLLDKKTEHDFMPTLVTYLLDGEDSRPAVVVFPGGGYSCTCPHEAERIAISYNAAGYHAFIVYYAVAPHIYPLALKNAARALEIIRENANQWNVIPDNIAVCGFSAGGHLTAAISTLWNDCEVFPNGEEENKLHRPNASILAYPVITSGEFAHEGSFDNLLGTTEPSALREKLSLENCVTDMTPPAYIWHTYEDDCVPVENSLLYAMSLRKHHVPFDLHIFEKGRHGLSLVSDATIWSVPAFSRKYAWLEQSVDWMNVLFGIVK